MAGNREKKDTVEKEFLGFPDIAADTINALLYQGKEVAQAKMLWPGPTETLYQGREKLRSQYEDLCRYELTEGEVRVMYLIANQSRRDGKMLLRKAGYIGGIYREQYGRKMKDSFPVIEFVLYWGETAWKGSHDLKTFFRRKKIPEETWGYVDQIQLHVFEMRHLPEEIRALFQSDMRIVVDFLAQGADYRSDRKIKHKAALLKMLGALSGQRDTDDIEKWMEEQEIREEDEITVCELFDQYGRQGKKEGKAEGIEYGRARQLVTDIESLMKSFQVSLERACEGLGTTVSRYEEARKLI